MVYSYFQISQKWLIHLRTKTLISLDHYINGAILSLKQNLY